MPDKKRPYRKSKISGTVTLRLPNDVLCTINRRINGKRSRWSSIGSYLTERVIYDVRRSHDRRKEDTHEEEI